MIVVTEQFFIAPPYREAFEAHCQRLFSLMLAHHGCHHVLLARPRRGSPFHLLHSVWDSVERFKEWTRSDAFVLAANGAAHDLPDVAFLAPKRTAVEVIDEALALRNEPPEDRERALSLSRFQSFADRPRGALRVAHPVGAGGHK